MHITVANKYSLHLLLFDMIFLSKVFHKTSPDRIYLGDAHIVCNRYDYSQSLQSFTAIMSYNFFEFRMYIYI